ncbi:MAG: hypothetical protein ACPL07_05150 [Candidatus Bathyarchaeia archaeon]
MLQLAAYEDLCKETLHNTEEGEVTFNVELPLTLNKLLEDYLTTVEDKEGADSLERLYLCFKEVGRGIVTGLKPKSLNKMHDTLVEYLSIKIGRILFEVPKDAVGLKLRQDFGITFNPYLVTWDLGE